VKDPAKHRFVYQDEQYHGADLLGLGASSFSHVAGVNHQNLASLSRYLEAVEANRLPLWRGYAMTDDERCVRELVLQLKLGRVEAAWFRERFGPGALERFTDRLLDFAALGYLEVDDEGVTVTRQGLLRIDRLLPAFYPPEHRGVRYS
jgi:oxygen-independent coproporphyrinogen-3 oxidase